VDAGVPLPVLLLEPVLGLNTATTARNADLSARRRFQSPEGRWIPIVDPLDRGGSRSCDERTSNEVDQNPRLVVQNMKSAAGRQSSMVFATPGVSDRYESEVPSRAHKVNIQEGQDCSCRHPVSHGGSSGTEARDPSSGGGGSGREAVDLSSGGGGSGREARDLSSGGGGSGREARAAYTIDIALCEQDEAATHQTSPLTVMKMMPEGSRQACSNRTACTLENHR
jgi:hypothetical protein